MKGEFSALRIRVSCPKEVALKGYLKGGLRRVSYLNDSGQNNITYVILVLNKK